MNAVVEVAAGWEETLVEATLLLAKMLACKLPVVLDRRGGRGAVQAHLPEEEQVE